MTINTQYNQTIFSAMFDVCPFDEHAHITVVAKTADLKKDRRPRNFTKSGEDNATVQMFIFREKKIEKYNAKVGKKHIVILTKTQNEKKENVMSAP